MAMISRTLFTLLLTFHALHADSSLESIGFRIAVGEESASDLHSAELFATFETPWEWDLTENHALEIEAEATLGAFEGGGRTAVTGHVGLLARYEFGDSPLSFVLSTGPTFFSESEFEQLDIGGNFHFTSGIGFELELSDCCAIGYRFQHISNAGLDETNPGLNMHALSACIEF